MPISYSYIFLSKMLIQIPFWFLNSLFIFLLSCMCSLSKFLSDRWLWKCILLLCCLHFCFLIIFWSTIILCFNEINLSFFYIIGSSFGVIYKNICPTQGNEDFLQFFFFVELLRVVVLIFRFVIDFLFISVFSEITV